MVALIGDAELDEGNIYECVLEGWKQGLRNCWWIVDYNRQSLDAVIREGLWERIEQLFRNFGWDVVILKYGSLLEAAFREPGGEALRRWIDTCPNQLYSALVFQGGAAWRKHLNDAIGDQGAVTRLMSIAQRRRACAADEQSRRTRSAFVAGGVWQRQSRPAGLLHLLHHQGLRAAVRGTQGQSRRSDDVGADGELPSGDAHSLRPRMGSLRRAAASARNLAGLSRPRAVCRRRRAAAHGAALRRARYADGHHSAGNVDADRLRRTAQRTARETNPTSSTISSPRRRT